MNRAILAVVAVLTVCVGTSSASRAATLCAYDQRAMLALDVVKFDKTLGEGWRVVGDVEGCEFAGAELIRAYRDAHSESLSLEERQGLQWHEAQLRAAMGQNEQAAALFAAAVPEDDEERRLYAQATIAFLHQDRQRLDEVSKSYNALPMPEGFAAGAAKFKQATGRQLDWPINAKVIRGFSNCFTKPYRVAYSPTCQQ